MKDYIWVVEVKDGHWMAYITDRDMDREDARQRARWLREDGYQARVRKYQRVGK